MEVVPSYHGYIETNTDALLLTQAVLYRKLNPVNRRPYETERPQLIISGNVFVFIEEESGIKRWTDGVSWSPSRIMGKFLVYRELDKQNSGAANNIGATALGSHALTGHRKWMETLDMLDEQQNIVSKALVGSLNSSYAFKQGGLVKKTMSLKIKRSLHLQTIHIISYYTANDVESGKLMKPSNSPFFSQIQPCRELIIALDNSSVGNSRNSVAHTPVNTTPNMNSVGPTIGISNYMGPTSGSIISGFTGYQPLTHPIKSDLQHLPQQQQYFNPKYHTNVAQHDPQNQRFHSYNYCSQSSQNLQQLNHNPHNIQRSHSSSSTAKTNISHLTASTVTTSAPSSQGKFSSFLRQPDTFFPSDQHKSVGIQLPLPFPHIGPPTQPSSMQVKQPQSQPHPPPQTQSSLVSSGCSSTSFVPYPGYNIQQYLQPPAMYSISRYSIDNGTLPYTSQSAGSSAMNNPVERQTYRYSPKQHKAKLGNSSTSKSTCETNSDFMENG